MFRKSYALVGLLLLVGAVVVWSAGPAEARGPVGGHFGVRPMGVRPMGVRPMGVSQFGVRPMGVMSIRPLGVNQFGVRPMGVRPLGVTSIRPLGVNQFGVRPLGFGHMGFGHLGFGHMGFGHLGFGLNGTGLNGGGLNGGGLSGGSSGGGGPGGGGFYGGSNGYTPYSDGYYPDYNLLGSDAMPYDPSWYGQDAPLSSGNEPSTNGAGIQSILNPTGHVTVTVPADAEVWFNGTKMAQTGAVRGYETPPLATGTWYFYEVQAQWKENGKEVKQTQDVRVWPGAEVKVDFPMSITNSSLGGTPQK
jgi:uncharacterized protein (TIGR03000 family)